MAESKVMPRIPFNLINVPCDMQTGMVRQDKSWARHEGLEPRDYYLTMR